MKIINQKQLLQMTNAEKAKTLKEICLGKVKYIGNSELVKDNMEV